MDTTIAAQDTIEPVLTLGRELRLRRSEVDSWLARLEAAASARHPTGDRS
ncbi:hypothetical protein [Nocardioides sp. InS609-2]|nr:hypothetical protein [Nocardioides sp. InS609-2]